MFLSREEKKNPSSNKTPKRILNLYLKCQSKCDGTGHVIAEDRKNSQTGLRCGFCSPRFECVNLPTVPVMCEHFYVVHHLWNAGR